MRFTAGHVVFACSLAVIAAACGSSSKDTPVASQPGFNHEVPCDVAQILSKHCLECHSDPPTQSAPESLLTYAQLMAPSATDPTLSEAQLALVRMQSSFSPMPPSPRAKVTADEIATWQAWIDAGAPMGSCKGAGDTTGGLGGSGGQGGTSDQGPGGSANQGQGGSSDQGQGGDAAQGGAGGSDQGAGGSGAGGDGSGGTGGAVTQTGIPCDVATFLAVSCDGCHGTPPVQGTPMSMSSLEDLLAPAPSDPTKRVADVVLTRLQATDSPMPPLPQMTATPAQIAAFQAWVDGGLQAGTCLPATSGDGGDGGNPYNTPPICTRGESWGGTTATEVMGPGEPCIACHKLNGAFPTTLGGTVYPTAHEPNDCYGVNGLTTFVGATVEVTDAAAHTFTMTVNAGGNFYLATKAAKGFTPPYTAKVKYQGRVREMVTKTTSGDCNGCHTQNGTTTVINPKNSPKAPGRILLP